MKDAFSEEHWQDEHGNPAGGVSWGTGFAISWQNGPLGRGDERREPNGAFVETLLGVVKGRIEFYQRAAEGRFESPYNADAIGFIEQALQSLDARTRDREKRQVEGTHGR